MTSGPVANTRSVQVSDTGVAPHILVWPASVIAGGYGIEQNADNTISLPPGVTGLGATRTSKPGDVIVIYCTGLGQTIPFATTGTAAPASPIETTAQATVIFGGQVSAQSAFAGLTPGFVGLYQVNVQIPANVPTGTSVTMSLAVGSTVSNTVNIDIASH
jgi:uncharacterized protein (TIGR03437 family)